MMDGSRKPWPESEPSAGLVWAGATGEERGQSAARRRGLTDLVPRRVGFFLIWCTHARTDERPPPSAGRPARRIVGRELVPSRKGRSGLGWWWRKQYVPDKAAAIGGTHGASGGWARDGGRLRARALVLDGCCGVDDSRGRQAGGCMERRRNLWGGGSSYRTDGRTDGGGSHRSLISWAAACRSASPPRLFSLRPASGTKAPSRCQVGLT